jgi:hypothetical protein
MEISHTKLEQHFLTCLWNIWKGPFVASCKLGFLVDQYDWKLELPKQIIMFCRMEFQCNFCNVL